MATGRSGRLVIVEGEDKAMIYTFNKTVIGHLHVLNSYECEDSSSSFSDSQCRYHIAVVADGHGSKECFRSHEGSRLASEIASECLKRFAELSLESADSEIAFSENISHDGKQKTVIKQLTDSIIAKWHDAVMKDLADNPPTEKELANTTPEVIENNPAHAYGTTLIAALQMPQHLILLQQGDGRCEVIYEDGTTAQPIPWDERCDANITTSMCDMDAASSIRSCIIDLKEHPVIACYLGSDGVEDGYRDTYVDLGDSHALMGGVHTFYKDITCQLCKMDDEQFETYLSDMLLDYSANGRFNAQGSGDDISVAGIVKMDAIKQFVPQYEADIEKYSLEEKLFWVNDKLRSKTRKHGILEKRAMEAKSKLDEAKAELSASEKELADIKDNQQRFEEKIQQMQVRKEEFDAADTTENRNNWPAETWKKFLAIFSQDRMGIEKDFEDLQNESSDYNNRISDKEEAVRLRKEKVELLEDDFKKAQTVFEEYDENYQKIDSERVRLMMDLDELKSKQVIESH